MKGAPAWPQGRVGNSLQEVNNHAKHNLFGSGASAGAGGI